MMKKRILAVLLCLCILGAVVLTAEIMLVQLAKKEVEDDLELLRDQLKKFQMGADTETATPETDKQSPIEAPITEPPETAPPETIPPETAPPPVTGTAPPETQAPPPPALDATLDFESMWETNPDICAWIEIDGTKVDYPVLQNPKNDNKYLNTAVNGSYYIGGSLFTQASYNSNDFNDPVTIIYGHTMRAGTLFGQLQSTYSSSKGFADHREIKLYLPDEVRYYTVFAAVPYSSMHILDAYDFSNDYWYRNFFDGVMDIRALGAQLDKDIQPEPGDRVIILSTCLSEDSTKRFLVMAIYQDDME